VGDAGGNANSTPAVEMMGSKSVSVFKSEICNLSNAHIYDIL